MKAEFRFLSEKLRNIAGATVKIYVYIRPIRYDKLFNIIAQKLKNISY